mgnify:CR=1 FL=1
MKYMLFRDIYLEKLDIPVRTLYERIVIVHDWVKAELVLVVEGGVHAV